MELHIKHEYIKIMCLYKNAHINRPERERERYDGMKETFRLILNAENSCLRSKKAEYIYLNQQIYTIKCLCCRLCDEDEVKWSWTHIQLWMLFTGTHEHAHHSEWWVWSHTTYIWTYAYSSCSYVNLTEVAECDRSISFLLFSLLNFLSFFLPISLFSFSHLFFFLFVLS